MMDSRDSLRDAALGRTLDRHGLIGSPGYAPTGWEGLTAFSIAELANGAVAGLSVADRSGGDSGALVLVDPSSPRRDPLRIEIGAGVRDVAVLIETGCRHYGDIQLFGSGSRVILCGGNSQPGYIRAQLWGRDNVLFMGRGCTTNGSLFVMAGDDSATLLGEDCMLASNTVCRTADLHPVVDMTTSRRINAEADIVLEPHVWLGDKVTVSKGVRLGFGSIVGMHALVTHSCPRFSLLGGVPARVLRRDICWKRHGRVEPDFADGMRAHAARIPEFTFGDQTEAWGRG